MKVNLIAQFRSTKAGEENLAPDLSSPGGVFQAAGFHLLRALFCGTRN